LRSCGAVNEIFAEKALTFPETLWAAVVLLNSLTVRPSARRLKFSLPAAR